MSDAIITFTRPFKVEKKVVREYVEIHTVEATNAMKAVELADEPTRTIIEDEFVTEVVAVPMNGDVTPPEPVKEPSDIAVTVWKKKTGTTHMIDGSGGTPCNRGYPVDSEIHQGILSDVTCSHCQNSHAYAAVAERIKIKFG